MSKYEINKLKDWSAEALHTHARHAPPLGEMVRPHLHGGENSPAYIIHPLQLISDPAAPAHHISSVILPHLVVIRGLFVSAKSNGSISGWCVRTGAQRLRGQSVFVFLQMKRKLRTMMLSHFIYLLSTYFWCVTTWRSTFWHFRRETSGCSQWNIVLNQCFLYFKRLWSIYFLLFIM